MKATIECKVTRGSLAGKTFTYTEQERVFIGRQDDCAIHFTEDKVSRYHCMLDILPPKVTLQDFGSLNGTYLNGSLIGKREAGQSMEEALSGEHQSYELNDGDLLGIGKLCEIQIKKTVEEDLSADTVQEALPEDIPQSTEERQKAEAARLVAEMMAQLAGIEKKPAAEIKPPAAENKPVQPAPVRPVVSGEPSILPGYSKISLLGKGGMGEVWKVADNATGKYYALKTMLPKAAVDERSRALFLREAAICAELKHKNVVKAYKVGNVNNTFYILMDVCEGGSADDLIKKRGGKLSLELATYITLQILDGLDYVHNMNLTVELANGMTLRTQGAVHRDFKPGNIFLSDTGDHPVAMVADFGMSKAFSTAGLSNVSATGSVSGTPVFMPRQQLMNCKYAKPEVDVWAAAASYYNMLTGCFVRNFRFGKNPMQVIVSEPAVPIRKRDSSIPPAMAEVIDRALVEKPEIGYRSAADFRRDLVAALPGHVRSYCSDII